MSHYLDVVLPTRNRWGMLVKTVETLERGSYKDFRITLVLDEDHTPIPAWIGQHGIDTFVDTGGNTLVRQIGNCVSTLTGSLTLGCGDDARFEPTCIETAVRVMKTYFPNRMGVVGLSQHIDGVPRGQQGVFAVYNKRFKNHFPDGNPYCPDYSHYHTDIELWRYAQSIGRAYFCADAKVHHLRVQDETTARVKTNLAYDAEMARRRKEKGYLWGKTFDLIGSP